MFESIYISRRLEIDVLAQIGCKFEETHKRDIYGDINMPEVYMDSAARE